LPLSSPLKSPPMFHSAQFEVVTKSDMAAAGFNRELALRNLERVSHHARIFELSAKTGDGMKAWLDFLEEQRAA
jgi:hydrogenase nickel incorporation protein HypB